MKQHYPLSLIPRKSISMRSSPTCCCVDHSLLPMVLYSFGQSCRARCFVRREPASSRAEGKIPTCMCAIELRVPSKNRKPLLAPPHSWSEMDTFSRKQGMRNCPGCLPCADLAPKMPRVGFKSFPALTRSFRSVGSHTVSLDIKEQD